jgi:hypothetical protein
MRRFRIALGGFHQIECLVNESRVLLLAELRKFLLDLFLERFHISLPFIPFSAQARTDTYRHVQAPPIERSAELIQMSFSIRSSLTLRSRWSFLSPRL